MFKTCELKGTVELTDTDVDIIYDALYVYQNSFKRQDQKDKIAKVLRKIRIMELLENKGERT